MFLIVSPLRAHAATTFSVCETGCGFTTIQSAIDAIPARMSDAYTVEIRDSRIYAESLTISGKATSATKTITLRAGAGTTPTIPSPSYGSALRLYYQQYVTIDGLNFSGGLRDRAGGVDFEGASHNTIRNSRFSAFNRATMLTIYGGEYNIVENNIFEKSVGAHGVTVYFYNSGNIIRNNTFINVQKAIVLGDRVRANTITENTFFLDGSSDTAIASEVDLARTQLSSITANHYYLARGAKLGTVKDAVYATLPAWQSATGFDQNGSVISAPSHPSFTPWSEVTKTVCAAGCDYATIVAAVEGIPSDVSGISHELITRNISYRITVRDPGPYDGGIRLSAITDADHTLTVTAAAGVRPMIRQKSFQRGIESYYTDYITIRGFWFFGGQQTNFYGGAIGIEGGNNNTIEDNLIENTPDAPAIIIHGGNNDRILNNTIRKVSRGVFMYFFTGGHTIQGNTIADTFSAVGMNDRAHDIRIEQNTFFHNQRGIDIGPDRVTCADADNHPISCNYTVRNTIIVTDGTPHTAFIFSKPESQASFDSDYNLFFTTNGAGIGTVNTTTYATMAAWQGQGKDAHSIFGDPLFAQSDMLPYDFHVQSKNGRYTGSGFVTDLVHSPAIDAGDSATAFDAELAPNGGRVNIGAYGNTREASKSFVVIVSPPPLPAVANLADAAWSDTTDADWGTAQKISVTVAGTGTNASVTLGTQTESWESVDIGIRETITSIAFVSAQDGFAVGSNGTILRWNGSVWSTVASGTTENLWSVAFSGSAHAFAVGTNGTILRWNGSVWSTVASGTTEHLLSLSIIAANNAFAVGTNGTILRWNGSAWSAVASGTTKTLNAVSMTSATNGWIVGNGGTILRWNGSMWQSVSSPTTETLLSVQQRPDGSVIVAGDAGFIARYVNNAWTPHAALTSGALLSMAFLPNGRGWISGEAGTLLETRDGITWIVASPLTGSAEALFTTVTVDNVQWVMGTNGVALKIVRSNGTDGTLVSRVFDAGVAPQWKTIAWSGQASAGATVRLQFATSDSADGPWNFSGPDGTSSTFYTAPESPIFVAQNGKRFARYQMVLQHNDTVLAPVVQDVTVHYQYDSAIIPLAPTPLLPRNNMLVNGGSLQWASVPGSATYEIEIARDTGFTASVVLTSAGNALSFAIPSIPDGAYAWRVRASVAQGQSTWSEAQTFTLDRTIPGTPTLVLPLDQSALLATPSFFWNAVADAQMYQLQIGTQPDFSSPLIDVGRLQTIDFFPTFPFANGSYAWRVRAQDRAGNVSPWSSARFTLAAVEQPPTIAPPLLSPRHGLVTNTQSIAFRWESIPGATAYLLMVSGGETFVNTIFPPTTVIGTGFDWTVSVPDGPYYWRVRGVNSGGNGPWSSEQSFTITTVAPAVAGIIGPDASAPIAAPASPQFRWDPVPDAVSYTLEADRRRQEGITETSFTFTDPFDAGTHVWRVQGVDATGNTGDWATSSFMVVSSGHRPPEPPPEEIVIPKPLEEQQKLIEKSTENPPAEIVATPKEAPLQEKILPEVKETPLPLSSAKSVEEKPQENVAIVPHSATPEATQISAGGAPAPILTSPLLTNVNPPVFEGVAPAPQVTVTIFVNNQRVGSTVSDSDKHFALPSPARLLEGANTIVLESVGGSSTAILFVDTTPPPTPVIVEARVATEQPLASGDAMSVHIAMRLVAIGDTARFILRDKSGRTVAEFPVTKATWQVVTLQDTAGEKQYALLGVDAAGNQSGISPVMLSIARTPVVATCSDGIDNDQNGKTDYPRDATCGTPFESEESSFLSRSVSSVVSAVAVTAANTADIARRVTERTVIATAAVAERTERIVKTAEPATVATLTTVAPLAIAVNPAAAGSLPALPGMATHAFSWLFSALGLKKKRKNPWGMVYDAITKEPIGLAIIRLFDVTTPITKQGVVTGQAKQLLATQVTDKEGRFEFLVKPGNYRIEIQKTPFTFPSKIIEGKSDGDLLDVYRGETVTVGALGQAMHMNIPLDPENPATSRAAGIAASFDRVRRFVAKASLPILIAGTGVSIITYAFSQTRYNMLVLLVYVGFAAYQTVLSPKKIKSWGTIFDAVTFAPVPLAVVSIIDPQYQRVLKTRLSDYQGRFTFLPEPGNYQLKISKDHYAFPSRGTVATNKYRNLYHGEGLAIDKKKAIIAVDVPLDPVRNRPAEGTATTASGRPASNGVDPIAVVSPPMETPPSIPTDSAPPVSA
ncbi:right-handed parallel beta-helix repeat-containing protein [Candidatus Uhrbacteria bacterium]|nr:right-handed parallel beta-helix repeat-containing protein [Candidatus Uhrbacteria bacterium]